MRPTYHHRPFRPGEPCPWCEYPLVEHHTFTEAVRCPLCEATFTERGGQ